MGPFLICWLYEEGMHGRALSRFLDCAGHPITPRTQGRTTLRDRLDRTVTRMMSAGWKDFLALHMTGEDGRKAAKHVDQSIATLPGFSDATLLGNWLERHVYE